MKVTKRVEHLLRKGHKSRELIESGFPKSVVTKVSRQLRRERTAPEAKVPERTTQTEGHVQCLPELPRNIRKPLRKTRAAAYNLQKVDSVLKLLPQVTALLAALRQFGTRRHESCPYKEDGLCTLETWSKREEVPQGIGEPVHVENEKSEWCIKPSLFYCAICTAYLESRLDDAESEVSGNPLSGAKYEITCKGCGSRGWIASAIKCTKCGRETYWGWWPKKE